MIEIVTLDVFIIPPTYCRLLKPVSAKTYVAEVILKLLHNGLISHHTLAESNNVSQ